MKSSKAFRLRCWMVSIACLAQTAGAQTVPAPILLWPGGAPGSEGRTAPEAVRLTPQGEHIVSSVHRPSITPYLPAGNGAPHAAVIVIPGGGHRELWMDHEGYRVGQWLSDHGVAAFVLKYRLAKEDGSTYTVEGSALADVRRATQLVRSHARDWNVAPDRIGVIGFSAGGELAVLAGVRHNGEAPPASNGERADPDFVALIYPSIPPGLAPSKETPPVFLLCGEDDNPAISQGIAQLYLDLKRAGASAELHILAGAGHGFGIRDDNPPAVSNWTALLTAWLGARGFLKGP